VAIQIRTSTSDTASLALSPASLRAVALDPEFKYAAAVSAAGEVWVWELTGGDKPSAKEDMKKKIAPEVGLHYSSCARQVGRQVVCSRHACSRSMHTRPISPFAQSRSSSFVHGQALCQRQISRRRLHLRWACITAATGRQAGRLCVHDMLAATACIHASQVFAQRQFSSFASCAGWLGCVYTLRAPMTRDWGGLGLAAVRLCCRALLCLTMCTHCSVCCRNATKAVAKHTLCVLCLLTVLCILTFSASLIAFVGFVISLCTPCVC
jgi:hypothetical protein